MSRYDKLIYILVTVLHVHIVSGQVGGLGTYDFLTLAGSARATALANYPVALSDQDVAQVFLNPGLLQGSMSHQLSINHNFHFADIGYGNVAYGLPLKDSSMMLMIGGNYIDYGDFTRADITGERLGSFSGSEAALHVTMSKQLDPRLRLGVSLKYANSSLAEFSSSGLGGDMGLHYYHPEKRASWAFVIRNIGAQISTFNTTRESWPTDIQIGYAKRLAHLPLTWMVTAHHLQRWDLRSPLDDQGTIVIIGQTPQPPSSFSKGIDNLFRHLTFGAELGIGKNEVVKLRLGYNHLRAQELAVSGFRNLSGLSFGFGIKVKKLRLDYGVGRYHLAGGVNHLSLSLDLHEVFSRL